MSKLEPWAATPKDVQREALKYIAQNGASTSHEIMKNIFTRNSYSVPQNMASLRKQGFVKKVRGSTLWDITTNGQAQANAWLIADGVIKSPVEQAQKNYRWDIISRYIKDLERDPVDAEYEPFSANFTGANHTVYFRRLVDA